MTEQRLMTAGEDILSRTFVFIHDRDNLLLLESIKKPLRKAFEEVARVSKTIHLLWEKTMRYRLNSSIIAAHGIWINQDVAQRLQQFPMDFGLGEILLDLAQNETRLETDRGLFFVFAGSQMVKNAKTLEDGYEHIQKKREELIKSGILEEQDQFYIFKTYYSCQYSGYHKHTKNKYKYVSYRCNNG